MSDVVSGIAGGYGEMKQAKSQKRWGKRMLFLEMLRRSQLEAPLRAQYTKALGGWTPEMQTQLQGVMEDVLPRSTAARQALGASLAGRGVAGGQEIAGRRAIAEAETGEVARSARNIYLQERARAMAGMHALIGQPVGATGGQVLPAMGGGYAEGAYAGMGAQMGNIMSLIMALRGYGGGGQTQMRQGQYLPGKHGSPQGGYV